MKQLLEERNLYCLVFAELKRLGVKVPKVKKLKPNVKQDKGSNDNNHKIFGASLSEQEWVSDSDSDCPLPKFVAAATGYLKTYTQAEIGLFRKAGSFARQRELRAKLENGGSLADSEPNDVASLLKQWLRELPEPVIPAYLHDLFVRCHSLDSEAEQLLAILLSCLLLPSEHLYTLKHLLKFLSEMAANSSVNKMGAHNLAVIMAPNLFSCGGDNANKSSNLVQCYVSLVEMLITNSDKVGSLPPKLAEQLNSEESSDFPVDVFDSSPYRLKKKSKSGIITGSNGVTDLMNGLKKFVGGNHTPVNSCLEIPELMNSRKASSTRRRNPTESSSETPFFTPIAKISRLGSSFAGPLNGLSSNTPLSHIRRKSFGLLNKKQRKRAKSITKSSGSATETVPAVQTTGTPSVTGTTDVSVEVQNSEKEQGIKETSPDSKVSPPTISPFLAVQKGHIKRAASDCPLGSAKSADKPQSRLNSVSTGHLPTKRPSSTQLQEASAAKRRSSRGSKSGSTPAGHNSAVRKHSSRSSVNASRSSLASSGNASPTSKPDKQRMRRNTASRRSSRASRDGQGKPALQRKASRSSSRKKDGRRAAQGNTGDRPQVEAVLPSEPKAEKVGDCKFSTPSVNVEPEKISENVAETPDSARKTIPGSIKRSLNKSSLRRGRPNTIRAGLPSDLCPKYNNEAGSVCRSDKPDTPCTKLETTEVNQKDDRGTEAHKMTDNHREHSVTVCQQTDGIYSKGVQSMSGDTVSPAAAEVSNKISLNADKIEISISQDEPAESLSASQPDQAPSVNSGTKASNKKSGSKKTRKRGSSTRISVLSPTPPSLEPKTKDKTAKDNIIKSMDFADCLDDTPGGKENFVPENEVWNAEAESFLNSQLAPAETQCKRESIIQLIISNAGKVQASVKHYDHIANKTAHSGCRVSASFSTPTAGTPRREIKKALTQKNSASPYLYSNRTMGTPTICTRSQSQSTPAKDGSVTRSRPKSGKYSKTPIPPPPKFSETDTQIVSTPLKEVTNLANVENSSGAKDARMYNTPPSTRRGTPASEGTKSIHTSLTKRDSVVERFKRRTRYSYDGDQPTKITNESRSESSPTLNKTPRRQSPRLQKSQMLGKNLHSKSFNSPCRATVSKPCRVASSASIRDIDDLKNVDLIDAWEYKM